jgi:hypothetical protein
MFFSKGSHTVTRCIAALLGTVAMAAVLADCGGGDGSGLDPGAIETSSITKKEFIEQADEICQLGNRWLLKQMGAYIAEKKAEGSKQSKEELFTQAAKAVALPRVEANIKDFQALGAPPGDETELEAYLTQIQQETEALQGQPEISQKDLFSNGYADAGELARNYGLKSCSYG